MNSVMLITIFLVAITLIGYGMSLGKDQGADRVFSGIVILVCATIWYCING